jgi:hypothetical protein
MSTLNARAVYQTIRELRAEVGQVHAAQSVLAGQYREHFARLDRMDSTYIDLMSRVESLIEINSRLAHENDALFKALGMRALKAMSVPVRVDQALVARLIETMHAEPSHRNSGN